MPGIPVGDDFQRIDALVSRAIEHVGLLDTFQYDFVMQLADRLDRYGAKTLLSARQRDVLDRLERRLEDETS